MAVVLFCAGLTALIWLPAFRVDFGSTPAGPLPGSDTKTAASGQLSEAEHGNQTRALTASSGVASGERKSSSLDTLSLGPTHRTTETADARKKVPAPDKTSPHGAASSSTGDSAYVVSSASTISVAQDVFLPSSASAAMLGTESASSGVPEIVIEVPAGEKVPAVFYETEPKPAPQQKMLDRIAAEFNETVANPPPDLPVAEVWEHARRRADEQYLLLYGHAAYNARHLQAAREAVRERRALEALRQ